MAVTGSAKFMSLVTEFAATAADLGHPVQEHLVAAELQQHITFAALAVGVSEQWVLRAYCDDSWARDMARQVYSKIAETKQSPGNESVSAEQRGRDLSVRSAARLVAGLGQALLFGNAVRRWRHQAGDSQERLERAGAEHCPSSICRFRHRSENGPRRPRRVAWIVPAHCQRKGQPQLRAGRVATRPETAIARRPDSPPAASGGRPPRPGVLGLAGSAPQRPGRTTAGLAPPAPHGIRRLDGDNMPPAVP
jgi:hypothetical protein